MRSLLLLTSIAMALPVQAATSWELLMDEADVWEGVIREDIVEQNAQDADAIFQNSKELFPDLSHLQDEPSSVLDEKRDERTAGLLTIDVYGITVTLADVPIKEWFAPYIRAIAEKGLVSGYRDAAGTPTGRFGPADNVTIEQMAKVVVSAIGVSPSDCLKPTVNATASGSWSAPYFSCAEERQWPVYGDGSVDAHRYATRAEVVTTLLQAYSTAPDTGTGVVFTDVSPTMQYGSYITQAKLDGIISGYTDINGEATGLFGPTDPVTRAEFAKIVTLAMQVYGE
ncbi:S-layer homology domain-containing protein [Candidatus Peribacteria bacterium]|nr:MAG: S-layer homology domain-containing protein [Candidatus Peribacteria bacterium]